MEGTKELMNGEAEFISRHKKKTYIRVFITEGCRFRAHIDEPGKPSYEVTINGKSWKEGKGKEHKEQIKEKMLSIVNSLLVELEYLRAE